MIRIDDKFVIDSTGLDYVAAIDTGKVDKNGIPVRKTIGYYGSIESAIKAVYDYKIGKRIKDNVYSLENALNVIRKLNKEFIDTFNKAIAGDLGSVD